MKYEIIARRLNDDDEPVTYDRWLSVVDCSSLADEKKLMELKSPETRVGNAGK